MPQQCESRDLIGGAKGGNKGAEDGEEEQADDNCPIVVEKDLCNCFGKYSVE